MINIKSIWENHKPTGEVIIRTRIDEIPHLNCYAATNHITGQHLYIMSVSKNIAIPELKNYRFKGVEIYTLSIEDKIELYLYLLDNELKDIFSLFIQNILEDIEPTITESEAITTTLNVVSKWKKLFDKINFNGLSLEQQKGLIGELLFLNYLLNDDKTAVNAVSSWTSAERDFEAKDFTLGSIGIEVKFTSSKQPRIKVSNERQLDAESLNELFLVLYSTEAVKDNGISLNSIVEQTRKNISTEEERSFFNAKLQLHGYFEEDSEYYNKMYSLKKSFAFAVTSEFPKIVRNHLPLGIYDTSYSIEISALENFMIDLENIIKNI
ncbi:PD-(D/E)XK motif protein [Acidiluteibacter ferrifornacis]|uniref:PD-(D/E)XK motif protein n=1 Tax=Acidiluteibacter ferrifornacis TaxID=2692424 RepID=A0A6N9NMA5_9FLAO|nr:PD-(D/E)XK motif protein [Acidiluteibacter ferrifornacis]NBG67024.1 PD-(D/E)XK motif protein [Acidiluteibacter ferrifornacis]